MIYYKNVKLWKWLYSVGIKFPYSTLNFVNKQNFKTRNLYYQHTRSISYLSNVARAIKSVLKLRYIILGSAIGGGYEIHKKLDESMPDLTFLKEIWPSNGIKFDEYKADLENVKNQLYSLFNNIDSQRKSFQIWFNDRLQNAIDATEKETAVNIAAEKEKDAEKEKEERINHLEDELINVQLRYQRELEKLEQENSNLRNQLLILRGMKSSLSKRKFKKSLIDLYSEVLDELNGYEMLAGYTQDHLPRVVVVGDQSSGKTSVLEMIAQARIFPRGAGEMMTRSPVKVTLSEGPYHIAMFKDSAREFDLTSEADLKELRREVELRMKNSVRNGRTVSTDVISMTVRGPGLQRMVLIDLPGIISTTTQGMADGTRESIKQMTHHYMSNPNAIILCIQDGSVDAERSNVTDLVSEVDPLGKRTIFVLTKVDLAEENMTHPEIIQKILQGNLFPMKALGYFAVVTGGPHANSIASIRNYEQKFFQQSRLFRSGIVRASQLTTRNLSLAVSACFWQLVRDTIEQQADAFKALRCNLETEWRNMFPKIREQDRDELFDRARSELLDELLTVNHFSHSDWQDALEQSLWKKIADFVFEEIYAPAFLAGHSGAFNTIVDNKLRHWASELLPSESIFVGQQTLRENLRLCFQNCKKQSDHDDLLDPLKEAVVIEALNRLVWDEKAVGALRVIQEHALEDKSVHSKLQWDEAVKFLEKSLKTRLERVDKELKQLIGPSLFESWLYWHNITSEQMTKAHIKHELERFAVFDIQRTPELSLEEITTIKKNLQSNNIDTDDSTILEIWNVVFQRQFLRDSLFHAFDCKRGFFLYQQGLKGEVECDEVILFYRLQQMLQTTSNALRQQIVSREIQRLEKEVKEVLEEFSQHDILKKQLLSGRRVQLAEELKRVREIQEKLEEFITALKAERNY